MFSFAGFLDLPLIWYGLIMTAMFLYVILDGFDLGVVYRPLVWWTDSYFTAGLHDPIADANILNHLEVKEND